MEPEHHIESFITRRLVQGLPESQFRGKLTGAADDLWEFGFKMIEKDF